ncbi:hypothetical protein [Streptomyces sp. NTH33]|uniref:hypothetical protein n=1 Tax=Streptomyces sp. NTH33 TaxID=1735453 RepID=UPI0011B94420|nr:hypothetical protein [Streptomyces sp. NTH33]
MSDKGSPPPFTERYGRSPLRRPTPLASRIAAHRVGRDTHTVASSHSMQLAALVVVVQEIPVRTIMVMS